MNLQMEQATRFPRQTTPTDAHLETAEQQGQRQYAHKGHHSEQHWASEKNHQVV